MSQKSIPDGFCIIMKKIVKLVKNPIGFTRDFILCKFEPLKIFYEIENLFVLTHIGQLAQAESLIRQEKLCNCCLVILYTKKNITIPNDVNNQANKELFNYIFRLKIPTSPNKINIRNFIYINNSYRNLLLNINPKEIFLFSFEKHYCLLAGRAKEKGIKINLVEEGTATYKYDSTEEANKIIKLGLSRNERIHYFLINNIWIFKELRPSLYIFNNFEKIFVMFPELLNKVFKFKESRKFFIYEALLKGEEIEQKTNNHSISSNDIIFLNQRYPFPHEEYSKVLVNILAKYANIHKCKVFIKLHPKDNEDLKICLKKHIGISKELVIIDDYGFLVESLVKDVKPYKLISLTSTSLVYSQRLSPKTSFESIYPIIRKNLEDKIHPSKLAESDSHFSILDKFNNIKKISNV